MRAGIQLYTLRDVDESIIESIERVAGAGYEGVELAGFGEFEPAEVGEAIDEAGLEALAAHVGVDQLEDAYDETVAQFQPVHCADLVIPSYDHDAFETGAAAREAGRHLAGLADQLAEDDIQLHYHNHTFEFTKTNGDTAFDQFAHVADGLGLEIDTGLANNAGVDPVELIETYGDRVRMIHLTDSERGVWEHRHMDIGEGDVDVPAVFDAGKAADVEWIVFEHGLSEDPAASMEGAIEIMQEHL